MIAVLLPTYNQAKFLPDALAGLAAQTRKDFYLIACDDGSTDETSNILKSYGLQIYRHPDNRGTAAAINTAASLISDDVEYITWVSSDNIMYPNWLEHLLEYMKPDVDAVYSAYNRHDLFPNAGKTRPRTMDPGPYHPGRLISSLECYFGPSFLVRREHWLEHREGLAHDYDWWLRFEERTQRIAYCPIPLCEYRMGPWQTGRNRPAELLADARKRQAEARERRCLTPA